MDPLISIITVVYNGKLAFEETIKSILNQTYKNTEYIIIDGGSTDGTIEIIKKYANRISYWISEPDNGIYDAMNKGLKLAHGEWINFINVGDTFYNDNVISDVLEFSGSADIIYGNYNKIWKNRIEVIKPPKKINPFTLLMYFGINHQTIFSKKELLTGFDCKYKIAADYDWLLRVFNSNSIKFRYLNKILINYDPYGISSNKDTHSEFLAILKEHYGFLVFSYYKNKWELFEYLKKLKLIIYKK